VDRLLKQIATFMSDIADEFKIVVVEAIRSLCLKFPAKHRALMNFLSNVLREVPTMLVPSVIPQVTATDQG
jgi:coatomer subunit gamma